MSDNKQAKADRAVHQAVRDHRAFLVAQIPGCPDYKAREQAKQIVATLDAILLEADGPADRTQPQNDNEQEKA